MKSVRQGKVCRRVFDPFQVEIFDRRRDVDESPYLIADEICFKSELKKYYPWVKEVKGQACLGNWHDGFVGLHYLYQLQTLIANTGKLDQSRPDYVISYGGAFLNSLLTWRRRVWFDCEVYADWKLTKDTQLPGTNSIIPKDTPVSSIFPDGLCIHIANNSEVVKLENQDKNSVWSMVKYRVASAGLHGVGVSSLVSQNRAYDEATSFGMQALLMSALGITIVDERVNEIPNVPGKTYSMPIDARMPNEPISNLAARIDMGGAAAIASAEPLRQSFRSNIADLSMASNPNASGLQPEGMKTATGVRYQAGAVNTLTAPPLELYAAHRAKVIGQAIELERKHSLRPRFYGKFSETTGRWFDPMKIPEDVRFVSAEGSWQPSTTETKREDISLGLSWGVGTGTNPGMEEEAAKVLGLELPGDGYEDWAVKAEKRLDAMKEALPGVMAEVQQTLSQLPIEDEEDAAIAESTIEQALPMHLIETAQAGPRPMDRHDAFQRFYEDIYVTDEFDAFPPVLQQAIETLWSMHQNAGAMRMADEAGRQAMATAPLRDAENQSGREKAARTADAEGQAKASEEDGKETDHARQMEAQDVKHKQALEMEDRKAKHTKEIESVRAKSRPKPQAKKKGRR